MLSVGTGSPSGIKMLDLFSGIGGFHLGLERAGYKIGWSGFCEIDKYASAVYKRRFPDAQELGDIRAIQPERDLPDHIDVLCGGFPCQSFSIAGKRRSFEDTRGTLFFEIARILKYYRDVGRPISYFILENVKGLYSAGDHSVLPTIYGILTDLDYTVESQLLNTRWVLPQNRERIYIVGHLRKRGGSKIFPIGETDFKHPKLEKSGESNEQYCKTITARGAGEYHSGMQLVQYEIASPSQWNRKFKNHSPTLTARDYKEPKIVKVIDKKGNEKNNQDYAACLSGGAHSGGNHSDMDLLKINTGLKQVGTIGKDSVQIADYRNDEGLRIRKDGFSPTLTSSKNSATEISRMSPIVLGAKTGLYKVHNTQTRNPNRPSLTRKCDCGSGKLYKKCCGSDGGSGHISKDDGTTYCLDTGNTQAVEYQSSIRRLTPKECERLQGFPDDWTSEGIINGEVVKMSDTQRYKQCGNAVTVDIVSLVAKRLKHELQ